MSVTNTTVEDRHQEWVLGGNPRAIEAQEARGQAELVNSSLLPTRGSEDPAIAAMGIVMGDPVEGDPLFRSCTLPDGWTKAATNHSMHSDVIDDKGRKRIGVFYKAAFYDRSAHMWPVRRFTARAEYTEDYDAPKHAVVVDCGTIIFRTEEAAGAKEWEKQDALQKEAQAWLVERYPDWNNAAAYWD
jgi:hypothetical protein